jgi:hypothetical protein
MDGLWGFALGYGLGRLLHLHVLLVREERSVVVQLVSVPLLAVGAIGGLNYSTHLHCAVLRFVTLGAFKVRLFHLRNNVTVADHNTSKRYKFLDVSWTELSDSVDFPEVVRTDLDNLLASFIVVHHVGVLVVLAANIVHVKLLVNLSDHQIENWDNVGRVVFKLPVNHLIELENVVAVDV